MLIILYNYFAALSFNLIDNKIFLHRYLTQIFPPSLVYYIISSYLSCNQYIPKFYSYSYWASDQIEGFSNRKQVEFNGLFSQLDHKISFQRCPPNILCSILVQHDAFIFRILFFSRKLGIRISLVYFNIWKNELDIKDKNFKK